MTWTKRDLTSELSKNQIVTIDQFLPISIARQMVEVINGGRWSQSTVESNYGAMRQMVSVATGRNSSTLMAADLGPWVTVELRKIEGLLKQMLGIDSLNLEPWQVTRYKCGETFDYHLDCGCWRDHPSGERKRTIIVYLQQPARGGATHFRALNLKIRPLAGCLVVWNNLLSNGNCNHAMIHSSRPVWQGCKTILTTWEHEARYAQD